MFASKKCDRCDNYGTTYIDEDGISFQYDSQLYELILRPFMKLKNFDVHERLRKSLNKNQSNLQGDLSYCDKCIEDLFSQGEIVFDGTYDRCVCCHNTCNSLLDLVSSHMIYFKDSQYYNLFCNKDGPIEHERLDYYKMLFNKIKVRNKSSNEEYLDMQYDVYQIIMLQICGKCFNQPTSSCQLQMPLPKLFDTIYNSTNLADCEIDIILDYCSNICSCKEYKITDNFFNTVIGVVNNGSDFRYRWSVYENSISFNIYGLFQNILPDLNILDKYMIRLTTDIVLDYIYPFSGRYRYCIGTWQRCNIPD